MPKDLLPEEWEELVKRFQLTKQEDMERFGGGVKWLTEVLFRYDFVSLARCGMPKDEYESEARHILKTLAGSGIEDPIQVAEPLVRLA